MNTLQSDFTIMVWARDTASENNVLFHREIAWIAKSYFLLRPSVPLIMYNVYLSINIDLFYLYIKFEISIYLTASHSCS